MKDGTFVFDTKHDFGRMIESRMAVKYNGLTWTTIKPSPDQEWFEPMKPKISLEDMIEQWEGCFASEREYEIVKYKVTSHLADYDVGDVIDTLLVCRGELNCGLIFHPKSDEGYCASVEMCEEGEDGIWEPCAENYMNFEERKS